MGSAWQELRMAKGGMMAPSIISLKSVIDGSRNCIANINDKWVPARALGLDTIPNRFKCAWIVFTGKADALVWPEGQ